jgi:hypothetical protein
MFFRRANPLAIAAGIIGGECSLRRVLCDESADA